MSFGIFCPVEFGHDTEMPKNNIIRYMGQSPPLSSLLPSLSLSRVCVCVCVCVHIHSYLRNNLQMAWVIILDKIMQLIQKGK